MANGASKKEQKALATGIDRATKAWSQTVVEIKPGQRQLRLFYGVATDKVADREFEFSVIGPLPSFVIQAGGSIGVIAALPRLTSLVNAVGLTTRTTRLGDPKDRSRPRGSPLDRVELAERPAVRVRYRY